MPCELANRDVLYIRLELLEQELEQLFQGEAGQSLQHILQCCLEMLVPLNACSDLLTRIPVQVVYVV